MEMVSERLRDLREERHMTQAEVGAIIGITQQIYSSYELGKFELPLRHLITLANFFEVSTDYILGRTSLQRIPPELSRSFIQHVTIGDFVCRITSFNSKSKSQLVEYVNYLTYLENVKKK